MIARVRPRGNALDRQVASAIEETDRLNDITSALLLLAHADSRELVLRRRPVDVATLLAEATARAHGDGPTVCIKSVPEPTIDADRELLTQAMSNLISNAHRHAQRITIAATADADGLELRVLDDGPGFPDTFLPRAFDRFARADAGRTTDGAGLGLSIVQAIAELHGGTAYASNRPTGGADVRIRPERPPKSPYPPAAEPSRRVGRTLSTSEDVRSRIRTLAPSGATARRASAHQAPQLSAQPGGRASTRKHPPV